MVKFDWKNFINGKLAISMITKEECEEYCANSGIESEHMENIIHCVGIGKQDIYLGGYIE